MSTLTSALATFVLAAVLLGAGVIMVRLVAWHWRDAAARIAAAPRPWADSPTDLTVCRCAQCRTSRGLS